MPVFLIRNSFQTLLLSICFPQSAVESKAGVAGYRETQEALENVSEMKSALDQMKGQTLEDISFMVNKLTRTIQDKKTALAPIIKELRPLRQQAQVRKQFIIWCNRPYFLE